MTSELGFLIDLLLQQKLDKNLRELVGNRIKVVEKHLSDINVIATSGSKMGLVVPSTVTAFPGIGQQAPSTLAALARHPDLVAQMQHSTKPEPPPVPVEAIAQNQATAEAMSSRQRAVSAAISGAPEKGRTSPRKF